MLNNNLSTEVLKDLCYETNIAITFYSVAQKEREKNHSAFQATRTIMTSLLLTFIKVLLIFSISPL